MELSESTPIGSDMKRDGRTLDHTTLETIRLMAIERVREGESPAAVIASYGFNRTTIYIYGVPPFCKQDGVERGSVAHIYPASTFR